MIAKALGKALNPDWCIMKTFGLKHEELIDIAEYLTEYGEEAIRSLLAGKKKDERVLKHKQRRMNNQRRHNDPHHSKKKNN
jgi:hypothetical protein